jgi:sulfatase modifying factor 1
MAVKMDAINARDTTAPLPSRDSMRLVQGGEFMMGLNRHCPEERPAPRALIDSFWINTCAVTNSEFGAFVEATGYRRSRHC